MADIHVGVALSDANQADWPQGLQIPVDLPVYARRYREALQTDQVFFELQPETRFVEPVAYPDQFRLRRDNAWHRTVEQDEELQEILDSPRSRIGVHMPTGGRDFLSSNYFGKYKAIEEARAAMNFAAQINADYFVIHLAQHDKWDWERADQVSKGLKIFKELATYYNAKGFSFVPCIEILEYPKFPATAGELLYILTECRHALPGTQIAFNLSHLWRTRNLMIHTNTWEDSTVSFLDHLEYALAQIWHDIYVFQLGGCWESETHCVPGLHPQEDPFTHPMKLRESPGVYEECGEIDLNSTFNLLLDFTLERDRELNLVLEIHDRDVAQVFEAARAVRADLEARVNERSGSGWRTGNGSGGLVEH
jgi:hypothetical protein